MNTTPTSPLAALTHLRCVGRIVLRWLLTGRRRPTDQERLEVERAFLFLREALSVHPAVSRKDRRHASH